MEAELLPVRMVNEAAYCRRLFWLEHVAKEFAESHDTRDGTRIHARVDRKGGRLASPDGDDDEPAVARSVTLSSEALGIIAKIDIVESAGRSAVPVEYKRGAVPHIAQGAYDPERIQLCLQGLLLRESGYVCEEGVLYFAEQRRRVIIPFDEELIALSVRTIADARSIAKSNTIPAPLIDSPKCPRCSLVAICLPDETNMLRDERASIVHRTLAPVADDALPLYVTTPGASIGKSDETLEVRKDRVVVERARLIEVSHVAVFGNVQISTQAVRALADREIPIFYLSFGGWLSAMCLPPIARSVDARIAQHRIAASPEHALAFAKAFVEGKVRNQRTLLRRNLGDHTRTELRQLSWLIDRSSKAADAQTLLGYEGNAARLYFGRFADMLKAGTPFDFEGRNRRPPRDSVNALLSFLYALLVKETLAAILSVGLEPGLGLFHRVRVGRPGLALDLAEEFRPIVADSVLLSLVNTGEIEGSHFVSLPGETALTQDGRRVVIAAFERRMAGEVTHPVFGYALSYRRVLYVQARLLARALEGDIPSYPAFVTR
jgi:CRISP-associated protein Cas1